MYIGRASWLSCEPKVAEHAFGEAGACFERAGDEDAVQTVKVRQAFMAYDAGDRDRALAILDEVVARDVGPRVLGMAEGYRGNVARSRGQHGDAERLHRSAIERLESIGERLYAATFRMDIAINELLRGDARAASRELQLARAIELEPSDPTLTALLAHYEALALACLGEHELAVKIVDAFVAPPSVAMSFLRDTHGWLHELARQGMDATPKLRESLSILRAECPPYEHGRLTIRILRALVGANTASADLWVVDDEARAVRIGSDLEIRFGTDSPEWRIFLALVDAHQRVDRPALQRERLIEAGWPGEKLLEKSAKNRLHVTLSNLRKRGLRDALLRHHDGYALSRALTIVRGEVMAADSQSDKA